MKKIALALLFALSACGDDMPATSPDAAPHAVDAAPVPDAAAAPPVGGCMGNLPTSRTITINTGDPIPAALLNELQDMHAGDRRKAFVRQYFPSCWRAAGGTPVLADNPSGAVVEVWQLPTGITAARARLPFESGDTVQSMNLEIFGDGAGVQFIAALKFRADISGSGGGDIAPAFTYVGEPASWNLRNIPVTAVTTLTQNNVLYLEMSVSSGTHIYLGSIYLGLTR